MDREEIRAAVSVNPEEEKLTLTLEETVRAGEAVVRFQFSGTLNDRMKGFYRSNYTVHGQER